ncbi:MAG TPA: AAA family ATPase, partial [Candidatus Nanoarchaeia archaeon]|nr:AAA family ATPase [Candidatus Nanoarchaeia archaeon]
MFLEKLDIQGFKSFASKNTLVFPAGVKDKKGITVIVGPNGSGKSNVADAVRWVLGEQSMKTLRAKSSEDVIFSGSSSKGQLGMAEVSLCLNNEDGQAPIDFSQLVITRRIYRNGESDYLLNEAKVRLADIQILLAKSSVGQKTYSVIGQGMVESFLATTASERKEFFDEATGVRQFQI